MDTGSPEEEGQVHDWTAGDRADEDDSAWAIDVEPAGGSGSKKRRVEQQAEAMSAPQASSSSSSRSDSPLPFDIDVEGDGDRIAEARQPANPDESRKQAAEQTDQANVTRGLLLPGHVSTAHARQDDTDDRASDDSNDDSDYGDLGAFVQLDADASKASRYYEAEKAEEAKSQKECEICGEKGHIKSQCSHKLCSTCGAFDLHETYQCPVGISCFRCGQKGHRRQDCTVPNHALPRSHICQRCGSTNHAENSCPSLWRIYTYVDDREWRDFRARKAYELEREQEEEGGGFRDNRASGSSKRRRRERRHSQDSDMDTESEGEETDRLRHKVPPRDDWDPAERWCYNCTARGSHWGDDCPLPRRGRTGEPSVFSEFVSLSGPFAARLPPPPDPTASGAIAPDIYDVSVGPNASMHFFGGPGGQNRPGQRSIEEHVDEIFARAPRSMRGRVERDRRGNDPPPSSYRGGKFAQGLKARGPSRGKETSRGTADHSIDGGTKKQTTLPPTTNGADVAGDDSSQAKKKKEKPKKRLAVETDSSDEEYARSAESQLKLEKRELKRQRKAARKAEKAKAKAPAADNSAASTSVDPPKASNKSNKAQKKKEAKQAPQRRQADPPPPPPLSKKSKNANPPLTKKQGKRTSEQWEQSRRDREKAMLLKGEGTSGLRNPGEPGFGPFSRDFEPLEDFSIGSRGEFESAKKKKKKGGSAEKKKASGAEKKKEEGKKKAASSTSTKGKGKAAAVPASKAKAKAKAAPSSKAQTKAKAASSNGSKVTANGGSGKKQQQQPQTNKQRAAAATAANGASKGQNRPMYRGSYD